MPGPRDPLPASPVALFRYQVVSSVLADIALGWSRTDAIRQAADTDWLDASGKLRRVSLRTVYRWMRAWDTRAMDGLEPASRARTQTSEVLSEDFLAFLVDQKQRDPDASIPEVIRRARLLGVVDTEPSRTTVWRAARRMGLPVQRSATPRTNDVRPFRYPRRMQMLMCDGKHFRVGAERLRRVVFFYLDNATRYGLHAVVGTSESKALFLRGLYETMARHGLFDIAFLDRGAGFAANATAEVVRRFNAHLVHGRARYPAGRGAIERFNRTAFSAVLRNLDRRPDIDPDCGSLELRLQHYLAEVYNQQPHEALDGDTPAERWYADPRALRMADSDRWLREQFVVGLQRKVTNDNTVSVDGTVYAVPRGCAGTRIQLYQHVLDGKLFVVHEGRWLRIDPVDLHANAVSRRGRPTAALQASDRDVASPLPPTAAELAWMRDFAPIVGADGGFSDPQSDPREE